MPPVPDRLAAALADRYRIERELGAGGMATVYLAEDLKHQRKVAIKVLRPDLAASLGAERFLREVGIAARLSHPHILGVHDSGEADGFLYYVMPYVEGISLRQKLQREGELPIPEAVRILRDLADALAHAHRQSVVHRDIKPENVMLVERHALVMDFGVAKALAEGKEEGSSSLTSAGVALGTPAYMAPEQASGEGHVDHRADLYAWGVVAYELLAGQPPFVRATPQNTLAAQVTATPEPVTHHRANVPGALARLVMQCLEKKPADRPQTAEDVLRQLDQVLTPSGGMTPTDARPYQTAGLRRAKRRQLMMVAAVVVGLAIVGMLGWLWRRDRGVAIVGDRVVIAPLRNETGKAELADLGWRLAEQIGGMVSRQGVTEPVPIGTVRGLVGDAAAPPMGSGLNRLARRTGAGLVVSGSYRTRSDSVEIRAEVLRMPAGIRLYDLAPIVGAQTDATVLDRVAEQVTLALLLNQGWGDRHRWGKDFRMPASLAAYRQFVAGMDAAPSGFPSGSVEARKAFERALSLDPTWPQGRMWWVETFAEEAVRDSLVAAEVVAGKSLLPGDHDYLEGWIAYLAGDHERDYRTMRRQFARSPDEYAFALAWAAYRTRRMNEAIRLAVARDAPTFLSRRQGAVPLEAFHEAYDLALHALGRYEDELVLAQEVQREYGQPAAARFLIRANAGLGRSAEVERVVTESALGQLAYRELNGHGKSSEARAMCSRHADFLLGQVRVSRYPLWEALWCSGREQEAQKVEAEVDRLRELEAPGSNTEYLLFRGIRAARVGSRAAALAIVDTLLALPQPKAPYGGPSLIALRVLCRLGDTTRAVTQFREAYSKGDAGVVFDSEWHVLGDCNLIRNHPAVVALTRVKD